IYMQIAYKLFYWVFSKFSYVPIPRDAGDFSLIDHRVVRHLLEFPERDLFLRGLRAFVGFKQTGVEYVRPERMFGRTTNSFFKNLGWAKKGILSFSNTPLNVMSFSGAVLLLISFLLMTFQIISKLIDKDSAPHGVTTILLVVIFFGSLNLFGLSLLGEYLGKVFEEVKGRPHFIRKNMIKNGKVLQSN
ncbi:MAG: epimerase, partial [Bdellovibrionales bacterium]|nr:epimerase [Bdellovibrionales bacterium]